MLLRTFTSICCVLALTACERTPETAGADVLSQTKGSVVGMTVNCLEPVSDGTCNKKTCKKDGDGDCADFAKGCLDSKHKYEGTNDEGTCTRVLPNV